MFPKTRNAKNMNTHSPVCMMGVFGPRGGYICGTWLAVVGVALSCAVGAGCG